MRVVLVLVAAAFVCLVTAAAHATGTARPEQGCCQGAAWSPNGREIAFFARDGIFAVRPNGSGLRRVRTFNSPVDPSVWVDMRWSADAKLVAYWVERVDRCNSGFMNVVESRTGRILKRWRDAVEGSWSPRGRRLAYVVLADCEPDGDASGVAVEDLAGRGRDLLVSVDPGGEAIERRPPSWSWRGDRLAYGRMLNNWGVYSVSTSGGTRRRLATGIFASWSPTQDLLAFVDPYNKRTRSQGLYVVRRGSRPRLLLRGSDVQIPVWSPDGRSIAIQRGHAVDERLELLLVVDVRTGRTRRLAAMTPSSSWPSWSPDGRWIAVSMQPSGEIPLPSGEIRLFRSDTRATRTLRPDLDAIGPATN